MTLNVLRSTNSEGKDEMMKLIRYSTDAFEAAIGADENDAEWKDDNVEKEDEPVVQRASYHVPSMVVEDDEVVGEEDLL